MQRVRYARQLRQQQQKQQQQQPGPQRRPKKKSEGTASYKRPRATAATSSSSSSSSSKRARLKQWKQQAEQWHSKTNTRRAEAVANAPLPDVASHSGGGGGGGSSSPDPENVLVSPRGATQTMTPDHDLDARVARLEASSGISPSALYFFYAEVVRPGGILAYENAPNVNQAHAAGASRSKQIPEGARLRLFQPLVTLDKRTDDDKDAIAALAVFWKDARTAQMDVAVVVLQRPDPEYSSGLTPFRLM